VILTGNLAAKSPSSVGFTGLSTAHDASTGPPVDPDLSPTEDLTGKITCDRSTQQSHNARYSA
jgi:hypothetical protein